jgi:uncharacterized protein YqgC (DUF456 family)
VLVVVVGVVIAVGIVGTVAPVLPGLWLIWAACLVYGLISGLGTVGWTALIVITAIAAGATAAGFVLPQRGAAGAGVSRRGQLLALVLAVVGFFVIPVIGAPLGFALGILVAALIQARSVGAAWAATVATLKAMLLASGVQLAAGLAMAFVWVAWVVTA